MQNISLQLKRIVGLEGKNSHIFRTISNKSDHCSAVQCSAKPKLSAKSRQLEAICETRRSYWTTWTLVYTVTMEGMWIISLQNSRDLLHTRMHTTLKFRISSYSFIQNILVFSKEKDRVASSLLKKQNVLNKRAGSLIRNSRVCK